MIKQLCMVITSQHWGFFDNRTGKLPSTIKSVYPLHYSTINILRIVLITSFFSPVRKYYVFCFSDLWNQNIPGYIQTYSRKTDESEVIYFTRYENKRKHDLQAEMNSNTVLMTFSILYLNVKQKVKGLMFSSVLHPTRTYLPSSW